MTNTNTLSPHTWTKDGKVYLLRRSKSDGSSSHDFVYPKSGTVKAPDWNTLKKCGGGLHGWPWGFGLGEGSDFDIINDSWQILSCNPKDIIGEIDDGYKCKCKKAKVIYFGNFTEAWKLINEERAKIIAASSGNNSKLAASGNYIQLAASGNYIQLAASGHNSKLAASGNGSKLAASGYNSQLAASGNCSKLTASGNGSNLAASGESSNLAASGESSKLAASGNGSNLAASGESSKLAASGNGSNLAASGNSSNLAASGDGSKLAASGNNSKLAASGNNSKLAASGNKSKNVSVGDNSEIANTGISCISVCLGNDGKVKSGKNGLLFISYWVEHEKRYRGLIGNVGEDGIKADTWYCAKDGKIVEFVEENI